MKHERRNRDNHFTPATIGVCTFSGKTSFLKRSEAKRVARWRMKEGAGHIAVYRCGGHFHIGHLSSGQIKFGRVRA